MNILSWPLNLNKNQTFGVLKGWDEQTLYSRQPPQKGDMWSYLYLSVLKRWLLIWATCMFGGVRARSQGPVYTMDHEVGPWKMALSRGPTSIVPFLNIILTIFLCHGLLPFSTRAPLLPLASQNPLDHVNIMLLHLIWNLQWISLCFLTRWDNSQADPTSICVCGVGSAHNKTS